MAHSAPMTQPSANNKLLTGHRHQTAVNDIRERFFGRGKYTGSH
jgi:hypothetical protein